MLFRSDDFGTGYSSLAYLTRMPISTIKIDRCFVAGLWDGGQSQAIIRAVLAMAHSLGQALAGAGWPVVSGLAEGIDAEVHRGALASGGSPVGVLGTPLERVYPRHHTSLQPQVARCGLLVSEQAPGAAVLRGHFASRNRLLVALARAVVVVECPRVSGALHSADLAWSEGLPLWVVPADAARQSAAGSNRLLARGATPLLEPMDLQIGRAHV